jgi:hypothetical protein
MFGDAVEDLPIRGPSDHGLSSDRNERWPYFPAIVFERLVLKENGKRHTGGE